MSKNYNKIRMYYQQGIWSKAMVRNLVGKALGITEEEYELIVGEPFEEELKNG